MPTTTLQAVADWLTTKPAEEVICWDTFDPWHCLMVRYYQDQGYVSVRSEYDRAFIDSHRVEIREKRDTRSKKPILLATYEPDLALFSYHLNATALRWKPTASNLLVYLQAQKWHELPQQLYGQQDPQLFNVHYDDPLRPEDVNWEHLDLVSFQKQTRLIYLSVDSPIFYYNKGVEWRHIDVNVWRNGWSDLENLYFRTTSETHGFSCSPITDQWTRASLQMYDGDIVTLYTYQDGDMGTWQRQGDILVAIS